MPSRARKRLNFAAASAAPSSSSSSSGPRGFSLGELHLHLLGRRPPGSHSAESDCLALMRVCAARRRAFLAHVESGSEAFAGGTKMW